MKIFTIDDRNRIAAWAEPQNAESGREQFNSSTSLAKLVASWPAARNVEIWNSLPGVTPVRKFKDRASAAARIWSAVEKMPVFAARSWKEPASVAEEAVQEATAPVEVEPEPDSKKVRPQPTTKANLRAQAAKVAPEAALTSKKATRKQKPPTGEKGAKAPRQESKTSRVIEMLKREGSTTLEEIMTAMGWQAHTTRAMLSAGGSLTKKHGLTVTSDIVGGKRAYSIKG